MFPMKKRAVSKKNPSIILIEIDSEEEPRNLIPRKSNFEYMAAKRPILGVGPNQLGVGSLFQSL